MKKPTLKNELYTVYIIKRTGTIMYAVQSEYTYSNIANSFAEMKNVTISLVSFFISVSPFM